jgi:hypothetical protein
MASIVMKQKRITYHDFYTLDHDLLTKENKDFLVLRDMFFMDIYQKIFLIEYGKEVINIMMNAIFNQ